MGQAAGVQCEVMKTTIEWNGHPVEIGIEHRMILLQENGQKAALIYMPGVPCHVMINLEGQHPVWSWNGDMEKPTFSPSILTQLPWGPERKQIRNHVFVRDSQIQYLSDCTHKYAGKTLELPRLCDWPEEFNLWNE